jgi:hypothetical protein
MRKLGAILICAFALCAALAAPAPSNYGDALGKSIISATVSHDEQKYWKPVAYPTDNFGIATLYDGKGVGSLLCATSTCLGLADNKTETLKNAGYLEAGRGGSVNLDDTQKKALGLSAVLKLFSIIGLNGKYDSSHSTIVDVDIPGATVRYLIKGKLTDHIKSAPATPAVTDAYTNRRLRAVMADIVVDSLSATVKLDDSTAADVKATLDQNVGKVLGKDASFGVTYNRTGQGSYKVQAVSPVIVAVAVVQQPKQGTLEGRDAQSWQGWEPATMAVKTDKE